MLQQKIERKGMAVVGQASVETQTRTVPMMARIQMVPAQVVVVVRAVAEVQAVVVVRVDQLALAPLHFRLFIWHYYSGIM